MDDKLIDEMKARRDWLEKQGRSWMGKDVTLLTDAALLTRAITALEEQAAEIGRLDAKVKHQKELLVEYKRAIQEQP